jgi:hypothetical protein
LVISLKEDPSFLKREPEHINEVYNVAWKKEKPSFKETVKWLAPHVEFPITVKEKGRIYKVKENRIPLELQKWSNNLCRQVIIDLTSEGPDGLDGIVRILILQDYQGKISETIELEEEAFFCEALDKELHDKLEQKFGYIEHISVDYSERGGETEGYSIEFNSVGRWSQQGFRVPHPLFVQHINGRWGRSELQTISIDYPFVVHYDLNLSGDFMVNLTADRLRIVPDTKFEDVKRRICKAISNLLLNHLGKEEVGRSQNVFQNILKNPGDDTVKKIFEVCLQCME